MGRFYGKWKAMSIDFQLIENSTVKLLFTEVFPYESCR